MIITKTKMFGCGRNGINTNGGAAKVMSFDRLGNKKCPGTSGKIKAGSREYPKSPSKKIYTLQRPH